MDKEWYIKVFEDTEYLHNKKLQPKVFNLPLSDHRHCEVCWDKFSLLPDDLHAGYYEKESQSWICESCYTNFKKLYGWYIL